MKPVVSITASMILDLLARRHSGDVFVPECKTDSLRGLRLDAWVMKKAWLHPSVTGYEIKINRSDFINDKKWQYYLPYCNEFYFVCPKGIIVPEELEENVGLLIVASTGTRLFTKRKSAYRDIDIPDKIFRHVLACRSRITKEYNSDGDNLRYWKQWLVEKEESRHVGAIVSKTIREMLYNFQSENESLKRKMNEYDSIKRVISEMGIDPNDISEWSFKYQLKQLMGEGLKTEINTTIRKLQGIMDSVEG